MCGHGQLMINEVIQANRLRIDTSGQPPYQKKGDFY